MAVGRSMAAIVLDQLTKVFADGTVAVDALTLDVVQGEFVVLLGPTGCGKSTVLRLVAGLEDATSGHVYLDGRLVDGLPTRQRNVAMVFQDFGLYPHLTVADNIGFPLRVTQVDDAVAAARVRTEALTMGTRVAVLHRGVLQQTGAPDEVYADPATLFVAAFLGPGQTSLLQAAVYAEADGDVVVDLGTQVVRLPAGDPRAAVLAAHHNARVVFGVRADALT